MVCLRWSLSCFHRFCHHFRFSFINPFTQRSPARKSAERRQQVLRKHSAQGQNRAREIDRPGTKTRRGSSPSGLQAQVLTESLLAAFQQAATQGYNLPVTIEAGQGVEWGVGGRAEIPWASPGLRHLELTLSQIKAGLLTLLSSFERIATAIQGISSFPF